MRFPPYGLAARSHELLADACRLLPPRAEMTALSEPDLLPDLLRKEIRLEHRRACGRHWTYNAARHGQLLRLLNRALHDDSAPRETRPTE